MMPKKKAAVVENIDFGCMHEFEMGFAGEQFEMIAAVVRHQQETALELTKLVLDHAVEKPDEKAIYKIFTNASVVAGTALDKSFKAK